MNISVKKVVAINIFSDQLELSQQSIVPIYAHVCT